MRHVIASICIILLLALIACSRNGPVAPGNNPPVIPPAGNNPGGSAYQLLVTIDLSRTTGNAPLPVNMTANAIGGLAPFIYRWDVNGDMNWDYFGPQYKDVGVDYASAGLFHITLEVEDSNGQFYRAYAQVEVKPSGPVAVPYAFPDKGTAPFTTTLDPTYSYDLDGEIVYWEWDIESDGVYDYESATNPKYSPTYEYPGTYNATLRVTDNDDFQATASVQIIVF
jgi:PKD repeat protein